MNGHTESKLDVAIVGGGIVGLIIAMGLTKRNISVKVYEQASTFREIGAGVAFTANARTCMSLLDPNISLAVDAVSTANGDPENPNDYLQWVDGYNFDPKDPKGTDSKFLFNLYAGYKGFQGCHRAHLLDELLKHFPADLVHFRKRFSGWEDRGEDNKLLLRFQDGDTAEADVIIGCDGIKSRVRQLILGEENPASYPHFTHKVAFRALVPMSAAEPLLGDKARHQHMHTGPGAHILHFPVTGQTLLNIVVFADDPTDWPMPDDNGQGMTAPATRDDVVEVIRDWGPTAKRIASLLPDKIDKWAVFDTYDFPAETYTAGRVCLAGDAAHASSPHHGAGAGIGVEDALALATLLESAQETLQQQPSATGHKVNKAALLSSVFSIYDTVRRERSQWLVKSSREVCDIYEWKHPETGTDWDKCQAEITERSHKLWYFDIEGMQARLSDMYQKQPTLSVK